MDSLSRAEKKAARLSMVQRHALQTARKCGTVFVGWNPGITGVVDPGHFSIATLRALERRGLVEVNARMCPRHAKPLAEN